MASVADGIFGILIAVGLVCFGISFGTNHWTDNGSNGFTAGLFQACETISGVTSCYSGFGPNGLSSLLAAALMTIAAGFFVVAILIHLSTFCCSEQSYKCGVTSACTLYLLGGFSTLGAAAAYLAQVDVDLDLKGIIGQLSLDVVTNESNFGYSFYFAWISSCVVIFGAIFGCYVGCSGPSREQVVVPQQQVVVPQQQVVWSASQPQNVSYVQQGMYGAGADSTGTYIPV